ncbi:DNA fragmentation factor subunit beta [Silurus meridionalis]|uniref:DNA fragmentation factor subunit beta n=1 Tax=Silurus meridionalis TaxID=175797 RepID=UPI001EEB5032|nr:DNA fragmentation factor subunit beta [Silurus meridionalis]
MPKIQKKLKPVKVRRAGEAKKVGVAAFTLKELIKKACGLLQMHVSKVQCCLYEDGTILTEDYFLHLPDNTELVLLPNGQSWNGMAYDLNQILGLDRHSEALITAAQQLLTDEHSAKRRKILSDLLFTLNDNAELENREEDEDWFEGIDTRFKTKSSYMRHNCEQRIRSYLKEVSGHACTIQNAKQKDEYQKVAASMAEKLKSMRYHGNYFDRTEKKLHHLCTQEGWFSCQGAFNLEECESRHSLNPYSNRESRIVFSTWNLDHRIEKKRTIIPTLFNALQGKKSSDINLDYFYKLLFTVENLKLVHIVCHKKGAHDLTCDSHQIYKRGKRK